MAFHYLSNKMLLLIHLQNFNQHVFLFCEINGYLE